jgi:hypothetical protein
MATQQATPPSETLPLPIPSNSSSGTSPHTSRAQDDLALRCRQLARSFGHGAVVEQQFGSQGNTRDSHSHSPLRASPNTSPARSPRLVSSLFPLSPTGKIQPPLSPSSSTYPTPEGSFILTGIMEEEGGDDSSRRIAAPSSNSGALSDTAVSDMEQGAKGRQGSRTGSRMTALNSLKLGGESEWSSPPPRDLLLEPNLALWLTFPLRRQTWTRRCFALLSGMAFRTLSSTSGSSTASCS